MAIAIDAVTRDLDRIMLALEDTRCNERVFFEERYVDTLRVLKAVAPRSTVLPYVKKYDAYFLHCVGISSVGSNTMSNKTLSSNPPSGKESYVR